MGRHDVFGMVGHSNLGLADAIRRQVEAGKLAYVGIRHEGAAAFAASAFGKLTGRPAACLTIAGPGATNLLTGMWDAKVDRAPVIALTGQVQVQVLGPGAFQDIDLAAAFAPVAGWSQTVLPGSRHAELRPRSRASTALLEHGVAHLVFPDDVQTLPAEDAPVSGPDGRIADLAIAPPAGAIAQAGELIRAARRPVLIVGHGARGHMDAIVAVAERLHAPVITTFKAKGAIADDHPLATGVLGRSGTPVASWFMNESDLLVVLGASFSNHTGIYEHKPIIQVDIDPLQLGNFHPVTVPVWGAMGESVAALAGVIASGLKTVDQRPEIAARQAIWRAEKASRAHDDRGEGVNSAAVFAALNRAIPDDAVIAVDVGNHAYSFGRYFECARHDVLMSGYLGSIGFGYPAAMGAWAGAPGRPIVAVTGDGGFAQYMAELTTAVKEHMNITHVLLEQRTARQDLQGAAGRRMGRLADDAAQPRLLRVRPHLRRARHPRHRQGRPRRRLSPRVRARRPRARRDHVRRRSRMSRGARVHQSADRQRTRVRGAAGARDGAVGAAARGRAGDRPGHRGRPVGAGLGRGRRAGRRAVGRRPGVPAVPRGSQDRLPAVARARLAGRGRGVRGELRDRAGRVRGIEGGRPCR